MYADKKHVMRTKQLLEQLNPSLCVKYVFQNEVIAGIGIRSQRCMEAVEEGSPIRSPVEIPMTKPFKRENARITEMINRYMPKWFFNTSLERSGKSRFATTGRAMQKDNLSGH